MSETGAPQVSAPQEHSSPGPHLLGYLVLKVVLAQVPGLSGTAVPVGQSPLPRMGGRHTLPMCCSSLARPPWGATSPTPACRLTRLSSRLATMEANLRSPASSEMRKMYSGAETWLERWVRPGGRRGV